MNIQSKFPHASQDFIALNSKTNGQVSASKLKPTVSDALVKKEPQWKKNLVRTEKDPKKHIRFACRACGKVVERYKSNRNKNEFCSNKCSTNYPETVQKRVEGIILSRKGSNAYSRAARGWRTINGRRYHFRSRMEANYARYMSFMGVSWEYEPKTFWFEKIRRGVRSYTPDFYLPDVDKYIECKGWMDKKSSTKLKRMKKYYPKVAVEVVDYPRYRAIAKIARSIVPYWELDPSRQIKGLTTPTQSESPSNKKKSSIIQMKNSK